MLHENHDGHKDEHLNRRQIRARKSPLMMWYEAGTKLGPSIPPNSYLKSTISAKTYPSLFWNLSDKKSILAHDTILIFYIFSPNRIVT